MIVWNDADLERQALAVEERIRKAAAIYIRTDTTPPVEIWVRRDGTLRSHDGRNQILSVCQPNGQSVGYSRKGAHWERSFARHHAVEGFLQSFMLFGDGRVSFYRGPAPQRRHLFKLGGGFGEPAQGVEYLHFDLAKGVPFKFTGEYWGVPDPDSPGRPSETYGCLLHGFRLNPKLPRGWFDPKATP